ncbi:MAG: twin-arginine translocase subunit TatC [Planctomycetaceae bacterium]|nr:twin-arginine translocase subunit TatC [Planctomycetaceae bacterium]
MAQKDLFDESTMSFGEHLEVLRVHLWKAIVGLVIGSVVAFYFSKDIIIAIQRPVTKVMEAKFGHKPEIGPKLVDDLKAADDERTALQRLGDWWNGKSATAATTVESTQKTPEFDPALRIELDVRDVARQLHAVAPEAYPALPDDAPPATITIMLAETDFGKMIVAMRSESLKPRTDGPDEAFMIYLKVSMIIGLIISSPWIFFQIWQFVAAGLYPNERKYVYSYLPFSLGLFLGGAMFCFFLVIPQVLDFLFEFNVWLDMRPEIKMSTWISFALIVSLMFGVSFQLPLVMLLLERISIFSVDAYRGKRRYAILVITILSMVLTPSDPVSMLMMLIPLVLLYELGILICAWGRPRKKSPFQTQPV